MNETAELRRRLLNKRWRLGNLYAVKDAETGRVTRFVPRREQWAIYEALLRGVRKLIILKARRLGMSTAIDVYAADEVAFQAGVQCSIVDQNQDDASKKLNGIVKVALEALPGGLRQRLRTLRSNDSALELCSAGGDTASAIYAGKNARGGTNQILHVSEWGVIQADDPRRSEEILTGALPSAEHGVTIIETTWKGGRGGHLWNLVKAAMERPAEARTLNDWHLFFFPWWTDASYAEAAGPGDCLGNGGGEIGPIGPIGPMGGSEAKRGAAARGGAGGACSAGASVPLDLLRYFAEREEELGVRFSAGQRSWYARRRETLGIFMYREFPTTLAECFKAPIEGAIYADLIDRLRAQGAIGPHGLDEEGLVHTFWDLGSPVNTVVWYVQVAGQEIRVVDCDMERDLTAVQRVADLLAKGYNFGWHYLPHDAGATERSGRTFVTELAAAGLRNTRVVPRTADVWVGINRLRQLLPRMSFRVPACERGLEALGNYHTRRESSGGLAQDVPVHDWSSHAADALRMFAEAQAAGMISSGGRDGRRVAKVVAGVRS